MKTFFRIIIFTPLLIVAIPTAIILTLPAFLTMSFQTFWKWLEEDNLTLRDSLRKEYQYFLLEIKSWYR